ncbi:AfsR/SARP family transcriptional regulator [Streptomyces sp. H10-C2]|uniref:AfsR/SARP family transcriptional regulator n=1 Tax=unclassified Streptomyces TaxID=2593676 RepID=UPI0024B8A282|nr:MULTISPECIES: AfsR/SARP family transcriptional regulator [unclassified Streptomyces]MDJ0347300.1 AfsR/SARP family transcriptional regulator [Streptomyces sp. PH10-H1]MDJ0375534.1 AfsR/SARP family transcriptional regulator [Streptomyces sp. H10-C2]
MTPETAVLELRVLGPFEAAANGRTVDLGGPQLRGVLARLAVVPGRTVSVGTLVAELWGERPPEDAHRTVRTYVSRLRAALRRAAGAGAQELLVTRPPGYLLRMDPAMVDAVRFDRLAALGREALEAQQPQLAVQRLTTALGLWRGDAFAEFGHLPAIAAEATQLERSRLSAVEARIEAALVLGLDAQVAIELEGLVRTHPTRELLWGQLMTALYRSGRQAEALAAFRTARAVLIEDHGVEPSPRLVEIHRQVLQHDAALSHVRRSSFGASSFIALARSG